MMNLQRQHRFGRGIAIAAVMFASVAIPPAASRATAQVATAGGTSADASDSSGAIEHGGKSFRVVRAGGFATAADRSDDAASVQPVGFIGNILHGRSSSCDGNGCDGCGSCSMGSPAYTVGSYCGGGCGGTCGGTCGGYGATGVQCGGECGGTCESCGSYGARKTLCGIGYGHYNGPLCDKCYNPCNQFNNPCAGEACLPYCYTIAEGLYMDRGGDGDLDFDFEPGLRFTLGKIPDCSKGCEITYTGLATFDSNETLVIGRSRTDFATLTGEFESEFHSLSLKKVRVLEDIAKLSLGGRYISFNESVDNGVVASTLPAIIAGPLGNVDVDNQLIGAELGVDLFYPIATRVLLEGRGRAGGYVNFGEIDGDSSIVLDDDDSELAGMFELGAGVRYLASRRMSVFARGEVWYLTGVATIEGEARDVIDQGFTNNISLDEDVLFYGFSGGFELKF